jgi:hypothetical protein
MDLPLQAQCLRLRPLGFLFLFMANWTGAMNSVLTLARRAFGRVARIRAKPTAERRRFRR